MLAGSQRADAVHRPGEPSLSRASEIDAVGTREAVRSPSCPRFAHQRSPSDVVWPARRASCMAWSMRTPARMSAEMAAFRSTICSAQ